MTYKIIKTTDGKMRGIKFDINNGSVLEIINQISLFLDIEIDLFTIQYPYMQISNSNYTIILKEVTLNG
jgi:hypothetical protein